jgi:molybdopterin converting factor small subunit
MKTHVRIQFFASLKHLTPPSADQYPVAPGTSVKDLLDRIGIPSDQAKLIFINGVKGNLTSRLTGGDRIGIFPPVGGG